MSDPSGRGAGRCGWEHAVGRRVGVLERAGLRFMSRAITVICFILLLSEATPVRAAPASAPATRPAKILPQHQQVLFFFGVYEIAADQIATDLTLPEDLHKKLSDRIAKGRADAASMLARARIPPGNGPDAIQASAKIS